MALEERIGNVNTGLSEETISKRLKHKKYVPVGSSADTEPCCVCQVMTAHIAQSLLHFHVFALLDLYILLICRRSTMVEKILECSYADMISTVSA